MNPQYRPNPMATAALVLCLLAFAASCCIYASIPLGALSMIFALLSKGGSQDMTSTAKFAFVASLATMLLTSGLTATAFIMAIQQYGSLDAMMDAYKTLYDSYSTTLSL